MVEVYIVFTT